MLKQGRPCPSCHSVTTHVLWEGGRLTGCCACGKVYPTEKGRQPAPPPKRGLVFAGQYCVSGSTTMVATNECHGEFEAKRDHEAAAIEWVKRGSYS